jgi:hypothetical protein
VLAASSQQAIVAQSAVANLVAPIRRPARDAVQVIDEQLHRAAGGLHLLIEPIGGAKSSLVYALLQVGQVAERWPQPLMQLLGLLACQVAGVHPGSLAS